MRLLPVLLLAAAADAADFDAQSPDPNEVIARAINEAADLAAASSISGDLLIWDAARQAYVPLAEASEGLRRSAYYRPPPPMDPITYQIFFEELRRAATSSDRYPRIARAARRHLFTVEQVVSMMKLFVMGDERIRIATLLYHRLVDPEHFDRVYAALDFDSDRRRLALLVSH